MAKVLITGATAGIGRAAALHLARRGHEVFASGRRVHALQELESESGGRIRGVAFDVTDEAAIESARKQIDAETGGYGIDVLVNNAGFGQGGPLELLSDAELRAQYDTNVFGLLAVTRAFLPQMRERGSGRIINVGSVAGTVALPFLGAYASTKHAVQGLSESLRRELRPHGIDVVVIRPGAIQTEFGVTEAEGLAAYSREGSPYQAQIETFMQWHRKLHPAAPPASIVAQAIDDAISSARPKPYYIVPASNIAFVWLQKLLPARWIDLVMDFATGLRKVR